MKAIESFSVSESFGLKDLSLDEIENINGGAIASTGECVKFRSIAIDAINSGTLSGAIIGPTFPDGPVIIGPKLPIDVGRIDGVINKFDRLELNSKQW